MLQQTRIAQSDKKRIVIAGGGFAGLELAKCLCSADLQVVLVDKQNFHTFQPLLYQVATTGIEPSSIIYPYRKIFEGQENFYFRMAEVQSVDTQARVIETSIGLLQYDYLVIATGAITNYHGNAEIQRKAIPIKSIDDALALRNTILSNFEKALQIDDDEQLNSLMDFVIVGGGPTGVEIAGALGELRKHVFPKDYKELDFVNMDIHLVQSGGELLKGMSPQASRKALDFLQRIGVKVWLNCRVRSYDGYIVTLDTGERLCSRTLIWAAGVTAAPINGLAETSITRGNRLKVDAFNRVEGYDNIFAIGDIAAMSTTAFPEGHPMLAQPAIQQGKRLGANIKNMMKGKPLKPFVYRDSGSMATIGRNRAVADVKLFGKDLKTQGFLAWMIWMFVHLFSIIGFRNRLIVLINWTYSYFSYDTGIRLIIGKKKENVPVEKSTQKAMV
jgi:NADH dehydrogenase